MPDETDIEMFDARDWEVTVGTVTVDSLAGYDCSPTFGEETALMESLAGEVGFSVATGSTKGIAHVKANFTADCRTAIQALASARTIVKVSARCVANQSRYKLREFGLRYAIVKPATTTIEKQAVVLEWEGMGFGYYEVSNAA